MKMDFDITVYDRLFYLNYAIENGAEQAYNLLLLGGPDAFCGSYDMYKDLEATLEEAIANGK